MDHSHGSQVAEPDSDQGVDVVRKVGVNATYLRQLQNADLHQGVKILMRSVPQPVAIVTATDTNVDPEGGHDSWRGATISSFNTVTLDPEPIVSFNIKKLSSTFDAIQASNRLYLHFLTPKPSSARLADRFTKGNSENLFKGIRISYREDRQNRYPQIRGFHGALTSGEGQQIAFVLVCGYLKEKTVTIGDHVVLFATVLEITRKGLAMEDTVSDGTPCLVYADQGYHELKHLEVPSKEFTMRLRSSEKKLPQKKRRTRSRSVETHENLKESSS